MHFVMGFWNKRYAFIAIFLFYVNLHIVNSTAVLAVPLNVLISPASLLHCAEHLNSLRYNQQ